MTQNRCTKTPEKNATRLNIVTGAFGFSGKHIADRLLAMGERVRTLTNHTVDNPPFEVAPLDFRKPEELARNMAGASVLYNTYWIRFAHGNIDHEKAVEHSRLLVRAAEQAGVKRIVHISITNPSSRSDLPYFRGKALVEDAIRSSSLSYAVLRPAVLFGKGDILLNNIAWLLRRLPVFMVPGRGGYGLQPIFVQDLAALAVKSGHSNENLVLDAVSPETYEYEDLVRLLRDTIGSHSRIMRAPALVVRLASWFLGRLLDDVVLTKDEVSGLMSNLLVSQQQPTGKTSLRLWLEENAQNIGSEYASELSRHYGAESNNS